MKQYIGVDVSKQTLDVQLGNQHLTVTNDTQGLTALIRLLKQAPSKQADQLIVCEASGGYERRLLQQLRKAGYSTHLAHANHVKHFARAIGQLAKTDKLDAKLIRDYAQTLAVKADQVRGDDVSEEIKALIQRRDQLLLTKRQESNRLETAHSMICRQIRAHLTWLDKQLQLLETSLKTLSQSPSVTERFKLLQSLPSVGLLTAGAVIAYLPELGELSSKQLAALAGVAPYARESGQYTGHRCIRGGRKVLRHYLYMSALSGVRYNPLLKAFYQRLREKGKPAKVALTAVMRKLLTLLNCVIKRGTPWEVVKDSDLLNTVTSCK